MRFPVAGFLCALWAPLLVLPLVAASFESAVRPRQDDKISPKVFIISMFDPEAEVWYGIKEFNLLARNVSITGFSPLFPDALCTEVGDICQVIVGEAEINAATTITSLVLSPAFDLTKTYFLVAGIGGVNPSKATLGSVTFAKYAVQVALQYEFDFRETPGNLSTGYIPLGATSPSEYPQNIYGTEVFEVNDALRKLASGFARQATLNDSSTAQAYRSNYAVNTAAVFAPSVVECDVSTSDVYYSGQYLGEAFENTTKLFTNGSGEYCNTAQEDNATLEALLRGAIKKLVDFSRIIIMRTGSDFDRPYPGQSPLANLFFTDEQGGFEIAISNIYLAGVEVVMGILDGWDAVFERGVEPSNYIGDIFGSLGGTPDFGPGNMFDGGPAPTRRRKRAASRLRQIRA